MAQLTGKPQHLPARMVLLVGALTAFGPLCVDMYLPALPRIGRDLGASASAVQASLTACLIGLALGPLLIGPLSDRLGRRKPLFIGLGAFIIASAACAAAPTIGWLIALRFVQGMGGAAGIVIAQASVRDQYSGTAAARFFSLLIMVTGVGPIIAPQIGAELLRLGSWRILFLFLAGAGSALLVLAVLRLPETLPVSARTSGKLAATLVSMRHVATDRTFLSNALACAFGYGTVFAYVAGSSFALENVYGLSPQTFGLVFAGNAVGLVIASQINGRVVSRYGSARLLTAGLVGLATASLGLLAVVLAGAGGLGGVLVCLFLVMSSLGFVAPNATALAMNDFPEAAGSASALLGLLRFSVGAAVAPLVGVGGSSDVLPLAVTMAACGLLAIGVRVLIRPLPARSAGVRPANLGVSVPATAGTLDQSVSRG
jgi:DHA1 family bicyclomycin/chloramphenicol resistance-like MFS transporter